mmetsp:Transcript_3649/g.12801  ORF Transcript_3649/g.12801 Transcript_3649/m.12801 type:complete len:306 (+) Transcript_3649:2297-3214(+)
MVLVDSRDAAFIDEHGGLAHDRPPLSRAALASGGRGSRGWAHVDVLQVHCLAQCLLEERLHLVQYALVGLENEEGLSDAGEGRVGEQAGALPVLFSPGQDPRPPPPEDVEIHHECSDRGLQGLHLHGPLPHEGLELLPIPKHVRARDGEQRLLSLQTYQDPLQGLKGEAPLLQSEGLLCGNVLELRQEGWPAAGELVPCHRGDKDDELLPHPRVLLREEQAQEAALERFLLRVVDPVPLSLLRESLPEGVGRRAVPRGPDEVLRHDGCVQPRLRLPLQLVLGPQNLEEGQKDTPTVLPLPVLKRP